MALRAIATVVTTASTAAKPTQVSARAALPFAASPFTICPTSETTEPSHKVLTCLRELFGNAPNLEQKLHCLVDI